MLGCLCTGPLQADPCGVAIADVRRWRCWGALRALEGSLPGTGGLREGASIRAVTGDHGERYCSLFRACGCVTETGWPSSAARRSLVPAVRLPRDPWSSGGLRSSAAMSARPARSRSHRRGQQPHLKRHGYFLPCPRGIGRSAPDRRRGRGAPTSRRRSCDGRPRRVSGGRSRPPASRTRPTGPGPRRGDAGRIRETTQR